MSSSRAMVSGGFAGAALDVLEPLQGGLGLVQLALDLIALGAGVDLATTAPTPTFSPSAQSTSVRSEPPPAPPRPGRSSPGRSPVPRRCSCKGWW